MRLVSPLLRRTVYPALHYTGLLSRWVPVNGCAVVNYHGVLPPDHPVSDNFLDGNLVRPEVFREQIQFLKAHYHIVDPQGFRAWIERGKQLPARALLLTCDDGLLDLLTEMVPVLRSEGVACLFFVTSASCGENPGMLWYEELYLLMWRRPLAVSELQCLPEESSQSPAPENFQARWWNIVKRASQLDTVSRSEWMNLLRDRCGSMAQSLSERRWRLMNLAELKQLAAQGMSIGAHTRTHPILSLCSDAEARREIQDSKSDIEQALGSPLWAFAFPFGNPATMG